MLLNIDVSSFDVNQGRQMYSRLKISEDKDPMRGSFITDFQG